MSQLKYYDTTTGTWQPAVIGAQGPTGAIGPQGPSGAITVNSPITNSGTSSAAVLGLNQSAITIAESQVTNLTTDLASKATIDAVLAMFNMSNTSVDVYPRNLGTYSIVLTSGWVYLTLFTPLKTITVSQVTMATLNGSGAAGVTTARMGLYSYDEATQNATLLARTANDTTLFTTAYTMYTRSFDTTGGYPASYTLQAGVKYGLGFSLTATTMPTIQCGPTTASNSPMWSQAPRLSIFKTGAADLPTNITSNNGVATPLLGRFS